MTDKKPRPAPDIPPPSEADEATPEAASPPAEAPAGGSGALAEIPAEAVTRLEGELDALKDRHLRLAAEYENFRKRTARERSEAGMRAQAEVLVRLIDALDDLARFAQVDQATTDVSTLHDGITLVERKLWKQLTAAGLQRIDATGVAFDPTMHEAVSTAPASDAAQDNTVGMVLQPGYRLGDRLLRPARVVVLAVPEGPAEGSDDGA